MPYEEYGSGLSEFGRWHRVASEAIIKAAHDESVEFLTDAVEAGTKALREADNEMQRVLAMGLIRTALDMRLVSITRGGREQRPES